MNTILTKLNVSFEKSASTFEYITNNDVKRHIQFSLSNRIEIIKYNYNFLLSNNFFENSVQLDDEILPTINTHLNSIYIHISGGLDNLAWGFCYQKKLYDKINEDDYQVQRKVGLRNSKFLNKLKEMKFERLHNFLSTFQDWLGDLKKFRDPIAHRIILLSSRIYNEDEAKVLQSNNVNISNILQNLDISNPNCYNDLSKINNILDVSDKIGTYLPVFCLDPLDNDKNNINELKKIDYDIEKFTQICIAVLDELRN
jgi:hypothetical protein